MCNECNNKKTVVVIMSNAYPEIYHVYYEDTFLKMINDNLIVNDLEGTENDKITDVFEALELYIESIPEDECICGEIAEIE